MNIRKIFDVMVGGIICCIVPVVLFGCKGGKGTVVARVGGEKITAEELDKDLQNLPAAFHPQFQTPQAKRQFLENMITQKLLAQEAERRGLGKDPEIERQMKFYKMNLLRQKLIQQIQTESPQPSDEDIKNFYTAHQAEFQIPDRARVSHILVKTEGEAKKVLAELKKKGMTFTDAARKYSLDQMTKDRGGDMGYFTAGQTHPLSSAVFSLKTVGEVSGPVRTPEGDHVLQLTDKQPGMTRDLEASKEQIRQRILGEQKANIYTQFLEGLKKKNKVVIYDETLGLTTPQTPQPQMPPGAPHPAPAQPPKGK